jgi:hypothetical protein
MKPLSLLFILLLMTASNRSMAQTDAALLTPVITYQIIDSQNNTFGYDVYRDGKLMIHQTSIPAMPGNDGFKTRDDAVKVAELVMFKIRKGEMPPTVTVEEMKELGVIQ